ncbi:hypothetical protein SNEBB_010201 [Seison nebaliae]|nr:hypothetical protein SNEBB_010201 [Seison nebaliae]
MENPFMTVNRQIQADQQFQRYKAGQEDEALEFLQIQMNLVKVRMMEGKKYQGILQFGHQILSPMASSRYSWFPGLLSSTLIALADVFRRCSWLLQPL